MKRFFTLLIIVVCSLAYSGYAQQVVPLYISKQTGKSVDYTGSYSKSTDEYEQGNMEITTTGPITYTITPSEINIETNSTKNWNGKVSGDVANGPEPGNSAEATMKGDGHIQYSRPREAGGGTVISSHQCNGCSYHGEGVKGDHDVVSEEKTSTMKFMVHSIKVDAPDTVIMCTNSTKVVAATGYPASGKYKWSASGPVSIDGSSESDQVTLKSGNVRGTTEISVEYSFGNVSYTKKVAVVVKAPEVTLPAEVTASIGQQISLTPAISPSGSVKWSVSSGLRLNSGPYNYVAFITCREGGNQTATAEVTVCGQTITRTVRIIVKPCQVSAPDTVNVLKGKTASVTASANMEGTFSWAVTGNASLAGGGNAATATVSGNNRGFGTATVTFKSNDGCEDKKNVVIRVLDKPTVTITPQWSNTPFADGASIKICKNERRMFIAKGLPEGGTYSWSASGQISAAGPANNYTFVIDATAGGTGTATVTYTLDGETTTASVNVNVTEVSRIEITASNDNNEIPRNTAVRYTAKVFNHAGQDITSEVPLHWKVVYIPVGQRPNVGNWVSYDLPGNGASQNYTWTFPQGSYALPADGPPYQMDAWIEAVEHCTYKSGSKHIKVVSNN
jgi:hypothetical protein